MERLLRRDEDDWGVGGEDGRVFHGIERGRLVEFFKGRRRVVRLI